MAPRKTSRRSLAVIGDVGGHHDELLGALIELGLDPATLVLPPGLQVVQVGDLVHRGPDSAGTLRLVDALMDANPGCWTQLVGNHEAQYLFTPAFVWDEIIEPQSVELLRSWWATGRMCVAAAYEITGQKARRGDRTVCLGAGELLVTHAGLSVGCWDQLGCPESAFDAAQQLNALGPIEESLVWNAGKMLEGWVNTAAGPVWAHAADELLVPWFSAAAFAASNADASVPAFSQAHGHSSAYNWFKGRFDVQEPFLAPVRAASTVDRTKRLLRVELPSPSQSVIWGVDPGHGRSGAPRWAPLLLELAN